MPEILNAINNHKQSLAAPQEFYGKLTQQGQDWTLRMHFKQEKLSNQSREVKLLKFPSSLTPLPTVSPPLCQVRLSANPKRLLQREVQSLNIVLVVVSVCLEHPARHHTILLDKLHNTITTTTTRHPTICLSLPILQCIYIYSHLDR